MVPARFDNHVYVKLLVANTYDVWWGTGWNNWSRVDVNFLERRINHVKGAQLPYHIRQSLSKYLKVNHA